MNYSLQVCQTANYCENKLDLRNLASCYRSLDRVTNLNGCGVYHARREDRQQLIDKINREKAVISKGRGSQYNRFNPPGKLLSYTPEFDDSKTAIAFYEAYSEVFNLIVPDFHSICFFDEETAEPPVDTWIGYENDCLITWVPDQLIECIDEMLKNNHDLPLKWHNKR